MDIKAKNIVVNPELLLLLLVFILMLLELITRACSLSSPVKGYLTLYFNIIFFGSMLLTMLKYKVKNKFLPVMLLALYSFINKAILYLYTPLDRDSPTLLDTVKIVRNYGLNPPSSVLSYLERFYLQHPGLQLFSIVSSEVVNLRIGEELIYFFLLVFTVIIPIFTYLWARSLYESTAVALTAAYLASTINIYIAYASYSRGMLAIPLMLCTLIFIQKVLENTSSETIIPVVLMLSALALTHDFTMSMLVLYVLTYLTTPLLKRIICTILACQTYNDNRMSLFEKYSKNKIRLIFLISLLGFLAYELNHAILTIEAIKNTLLAPPSENVLNIVSRPRNIRSMLVTISRITFWIISGVIILYHVKSTPCHKIKVDLHLLAYALLLGMLSLTIMLLSVRVWYYAHLALVVLLSHVLLTTSLRSLPKRYLVFVLLLTTFIVFNVNSIPPLLVAPKHINVREYQYCEFSYILSSEDLLSSEWVYAHLSSNNIHIISDFGAILLFRRYLVSLEVIKLENTTVGNAINLNGSILFWRSPQMDYSLIYGTGMCVRTPSNLYSLLMHSCSIIFQSKYIKVIRG